MKKFLFIFFLIYLTIGFVDNGLAQMEDIAELTGREKTEVLRIYELIKALDLDEKTAIRFFPILNKYDKKRAEINHKIREDIRELKEALKEKSEAQIKDILKRLQQNRKALQELNDEKNAELKNVLTVEQQAKYMLFQYKFPKELRKKISGRRHIR
jgi:Spy/CpxP family protein refolding chaperone